MTEPAPKKTVGAAVKPVAAEDWKIQFNKKIGGDLFNLRAASAEEFEQLTEDLAKVADNALTNIGTFVQAVLAKSITTEIETHQTESRGSFKSAATTKASADGPPSCAHGPMKDLAAKGYRHRYYCNARNRDEQCAARD